jgi:hypothetical protein
MRSKRGTNWGAWIVIGIVALIVLGAIGNVSNSGGFNVQPPDFGGPTYDYSVVATDAPTVFVPDTFPPADPLVAVGSLQQDRAGHTATLLDDGRVLIAGGYGVDAMGSKTALDGVEIYDPIGQSFEGGGSLLGFRSDAVAAKLRDGTVLIAGGNDVHGSATDSAEIYDPQAQVSVTTGRMAGQVASAAAVTLDDGRVLIVGGINAGEPRVGAQIFDPATGVFTSIPSDFYGSMTATKLQDGRVLVAGGLGSDGSPSDAAWIFDPSSEGFMQVGNMSVARSKATAGLLPDGRVMVVGGMGTDGVVNHTADIYDPNVEAFTSTQDLADYRYRGTTTILSDGSALLAGGVDQSGIPVTSVELDFPGQMPNDIGSMAVGRADQTATLLNDGTVLVVGGITASGVTTGSAGIYPLGGIKSDAPSGSAAASASAGASESPSDSQWPPIDPSAAASQ